MKRGQLLRLTAGLALAVVGAIGANRTVVGFYDDTHYSFTYYMARACGYTPLQAYRIASADVSIDYSAPTEPVRGLYPSVENQQPRVDFHAMRNALRFKAPDRAVADQAILTQGEALAAAARAMRNPGIYLHYLQDQFSHAGYASDGGHWVGAVPIGDPRTGGVQSITPVRDPITGINPFGDALADPFLPQGATTDFLSYNSRVAERMVGRTLGFLTQFMTQLSAGQQRPVPCSAREMSPVLAGLIRANPLPPMLDQYAENLAKQAKQRVPKAVPLPEIVSQYAATRGTPRTGPANELIAQRLKAGRDLKPYPDGRLPYEYTGQGQLAGTNQYSTPDGFTLYGTLRAKLERVEATPLQVSVWAPPTKLAERPYLLRCDDSNAVSAIQSTDVKFDNLPVGDLIVQTTSSNGTITRQLVSLEKLEQDVVINVPRETARTKSCGKDAVKTSSLACVMVGPKASKTPNQLAQLNQLEQRLESEYAKAASCERQGELRTSTPTAAPTAPQPTAAKKKGGHTGAIIAGVGAAAGGAVAYSEFKKYLDSQEKSSTGSSGSGSGSSTQCLSSRNCINSGLSCSCAGSTSGSCGFPASPRGSTEGGSCPCAVGYSCTNNRCTATGSCR